MRLQILFRDDTERPKAAAACASGMVRYGSMMSREKEDGVRLRLGCVMAGVTDGP